jgi:hypothetical protein
MRWLWWGLPILLLGAAIAGALELRSRVRERYGHLHSARTLEQALQQAARQHSDRVQIRTIGTSHEGKKILAVRLSRAGQAAPAMLFQAGLRGSDHLGTELCLLLLQRLLSGEDSALASRLQRLAIWIIPMPNPDGTVHDLRTGPDVPWMLNRGLNSNGQHGIDLAANFPWATAPSDNDDWREERERISAGSTPFSEPETRALRDFIEKQRTEHRLTALVVIGQGPQRMLIGPDRGMLRAKSSPALKQRYRDLQQRMRGKKSEFSLLIPTAEMEQLPMIRSQVDWAFDSQGLFALELHQSIYENPSWPSKDDIQQAFEGVLPQLLDLMDSVAPR